ncbi:MAG: Txe/YoeB family addiction module toxin [Rikenellaceae bacterium]
MNYRLEFSEPFKDDVKRHAKSGNKNIIRKIESLLGELSEYPRSGTGKPEQLKGKEFETWSRRLDDKHRLVYEIYDDTLLVHGLTAYGHYGDK